LKTFYVKVKGDKKDEIDKKFGARITQENNPFIIKYHCKLEVDLTKEILDHLSVFYNLNEVDLTGMLKTPLVNKTFRIPEPLFTSPYPFPKPPYDGFLMEYANGTTLGKLSFRNMTEERLIKILYGIISSIQTLHSIGVIHNDIKGNNYILLPNYVVKLCMVLLYVYCFIFLFI
jgi:serine/threonine protein kinase